MKLLTDILTNRRAFIGSSILILIIIISLFAPLIAPYNPTEFHLTDKYSAPNISYLFGTDNYGRDVLSRVLMGSRRTLAIGFGATLLSLAIGVPIGLASGYWGGNWDELIMRLNDSLLSIPSLLLALLIVVVLGSSLLNAIWAIGIVFSPRVARVARSIAISVKTERFVDAARARGESDLYIIFREILPNAWPTIVVEGTYRIGFAIFTGASLSFLGLGAQPPYPEWGLMIRQARTQILISPWPLIFPSLFIILIIIASNLLGDGLSDILGSEKR